MNNERFFSRLLRKKMLFSPRITRRKFAKITLRVISSQLAEEEKKLKFHNFHNLNFRLCHGRLKKDAYIKVLVVCRKKIGGQVSRIPQMKSQQRRMRKRIFAYLYN